MKLTHTLALFWGGNPINQYLPYRISCLKYFAQLLTSYDWRFARDWIVMKLSEWNGKET